MQSSVLTSSRFGKFFPRRTHNLQTVEFSACGTVEQLQFTITSDRLYLLDAEGGLSCLSLTDNSLSTLPGVRLAHFEIETSNCFSVCGVGRQAEVVRVWLESKRSSRVASLGLTRVLSFQKNHLTNLLLVVDFQLVLLLDGPTGNRISALKADNGDTFSCGRFLDQNRFIVLAVRGSELRVVEILGMKTVERITLPFEIKAIKLQATLDGSAVAVQYDGDSNMLLVLRVSPYGRLSYQMAELPIRSVLCARFTHQNDLLLLGSDRILYGIPHRTSRLVQLFNPEQKLRITCFDVALHTNTIALAAAKTIHLLALPHGVRKALEEREGITLEFAEQATSGQALKVERETEEDQKGGSESGNLVNPEAAVPADMPDFSGRGGEIQSQVRELKASRSQQASINAIYLYVHQFQPSRRLVHLHKAEVVGFIHRLLSLLKDPRQTALAAYHLLTQLATATSDGSLDKFALILAPRVFERIQKTEGEFGEFAGRTLLRGFADYLSEDGQTQALVAMVKNCHSENFLPIFLLSLFLQMRANSPTWPLPHQQIVRLPEVLAETHNLMSNPRHAYIFAREVPEREEEKGEQLELLLARQEELRQSLEGLRRERS